MLNRIIVKFCPSSAYENLFAGCVYEGSTQRRPVVAVVLSVCQRRSRRLDDFVSAFLDADIDLLSFVAFSDWHFQQQIKYCNCIAVVCFHLGLLSVKIVSPSLVNNDRRL